MDASVVCEGRHICDWKRWMARLRRLESMQIEKIWSNSTSHLGMPSKIGRT